MVRSTRLGLITILIVLSALAVPGPSAQPALTIGGYVKVSEVAVTRTVSQYVYRATLTNGGPPLAGATATATSGSPATTIVDGSLTFGSVGAGGSIGSSDTFSFRQDRLVPFSFSNIQWSITPVVGNRPPVANAGPDQTIGGIGTSVQLDGSASSDPDSDPLTYHWTLTLPPGSAATLSNATSVSPTFVPDRKGSYAAQLVVNDGTLASNPDLVTVTIGNTAPMANAGPDQTKGVGTTAMLNGAASSDADGDPLTYSWAFQSLPTGSSAVLSNPAAVNPSFVVDVSGSYVARLIVNDGTANSPADVVVINTNNSAPVANAGADRTASVGQTVGLDGSGSSDVDGDPLTFVWTFVSIPTGSTAVLNNPSAVTPQFVVDKPGTFRLQLVVNDGIVSSAPDFVDVTSQNSPPVANAGADQTVAAGALVTLNGSGSTDADGDPLTYSWSLTNKPAGSTAVLSNPTSVMPTFVSDKVGTYVAQLVVNDGVSPSAPDTVTITNQNSAPTANAGPDQSVIAGQTVLLNGTASSDPDGDPLTFAWSFTSRPTNSSATLFGNTSAGPSFTADLPGTYVVQLIVNDGLLPSAPDTANITTSNTTPVANAGPDQIGVPVSSVVTLDGSASSDADGHALTFSWSLLSSPVGSGAALANPTAVNPTFNADMAGDYVAQLIVDDGFGPSAPDTILVRVVTAALPEVSIATIDASASEAGPDTGTFTVSRTGTTTNSLTVLYDISGSATNGSDYQFIAASVVIPAGSASAAVTITPNSDALIEGDESVALTILSNANYTITPPGTTLLTIHDAPPTPVVTVAATDDAASEVGADVGVFRFTRSEDTTSPLTVQYSISGSATNGSDYNSISGSIVIPGGQAFADLTITPIADGTPEPSETVAVTIVDTASYDPGTPSSATVTIADSSPVVTVVATDSGASENGPDTGTFTFTRTGTTSAALTVNFTVGGTATIGQDYTSLGSTVIIPVGQASATTVVTPIPDGQAEPDESVILTLAAGAYNIGTPGAATVTIGDCAGDGGTLVNGAMQCGNISTAGETDTWTFTATAGDRIAVHIGEIFDNNDFRPRITLRSPTAATLVDTSGFDAAAIDGVAAPVTGTYVVLVSSFDSGLDGTGSYRISMAHTPGPIVVSTGDQGGPLINGAIHTGEILRGDLDTWTFTANAGDRIAVHIGQITDNDDFRPWIRLWAPNGAILASTSGTDAAVIDGVAAPVTGTYLVLVSSFDSVYDGTGTYRLTMAKTPGPITVSPGDQGGPLTTGATHTGEIVKGDLDVWTFTANVGDRIGIHIGEIVDNSDFRPWIRLWAPNGANLGSTSGIDAAVLDGIAATVSGTYLVLVGSFDSGYDGAGTYRLTMTKTPDPITISPGDEGGPLINGAIHTGAIVRGDLDTWTFTANAGDRIGVHIGQITDNDDFRPWIRLWAPNGAILASTSGTDAAVIDGVAAPVTGTYLVLVSSFDSIYDGTGTYRLTMTKTPGPITVSPGDEGGPLINGATHIGEIVKGDLDVWTFTANVGDRIDLHIGEIADASDFRPWIRLWAPNGAILGSTSGVDAAVLDGIAAPVTGTYLVLVGSFDSGYDGAGTYRLTWTKTPGPITVSPGDEGGPLTNGATQTGEIVRGDVDVWTFDATVGERIDLHIGEITDTSDFRPWIRLWAPNGAVLGSTSGVAAAVLDGIAAPVTGTYLVLVGSFDSAFNGTGTYRLTMTKTPGPITISSGDEGGPLINGGTHTGEIVVGDLDVWTISAVAGQKITVEISQVSETDDFRPWIRVWAPNGTILSSVAGVDAATTTALTAPVTGNYLVLVGSFDSGFNGTGTYSLRVTVTP